jgi:drug/metabolite transporter (DMT)-like permease
MCFTNIFDHFLTNIVKQGSSLLAWGLLIFLAFTWGSSFILMKKAMFHGANEPLFSAFQVASMRIVIAALVLLPFVFHKIVEVIKNGFWKPILITGVFGNGIPAFLFTLAQTKIESSLAGMLNSLTPIFAVLIAFIIFKTKFAVSQVVGLVLAFCGAAGMLLFNGKGLNLENVEYGLLIVLATLFYGISINTIKNYLGTIKSVHAAGLAFNSLLIPALVALSFSGVEDVFANNPHAFEGLGYIMILSVIGTAFAVVIYNRLINLTSVIFASSVTYLIPIFALFWGWYFGEVITPQRILFMAVVLFGVFLINRKRKAA